MNLPDYTIRPMQPNEIALAIGWAAKEGWNPGIEDIGPFAAADPTGFLIGELNGQPIATISAVCYGNQFGFLGFYIVHPDFRGRGHGIAIWNAAMDYLGVRTVGLDGVVDQQDNYRKSGFTLAYRNIRQGGTATHSKTLDPRIRPLDTIPFKTLSEYDQHFFPANRDAFLQKWITLPQSYAFASVEDDKIRGYGCIRPCRSGWKVGPLFADSPAIAENLLQALINSIPEAETFFLDTPEPNPQALALAQKHDMRPVFETARMYKGAAPAVTLEGIFGVTTFELG